MKSRLFGTALSTLSVLAGSTALADVTAQEVWDDWQANMVLFGELNVTSGSETYQDGTLTVSDLAITFSDGDGQVTSVMDALVFTENGDGSVSVTVPEIYPVTMESNDGVERLVLTFRQDNANIVVSGTPGALNYAITADDYEMRVSELQSSEDVALEVFVKASGVSGNYQTDTSEGVRTSYDVSLDSVEMLMDISGDDLEALVFSGQLDSVATAGVFAFPEGADLNDPENFAAEMDVQSQTLTNGAAFIFEFQEAGGLPVSGSMTAGVIEATSDMNPATLGYDFSFNDLAVNATGGDLPFPVAVTMKALENTILFPVGETEEPTDFRYRFALQDLTVNDEIWGMGDPTGQLPRDPATLILDLAGKAKLAFNLLDPNQMAALAFGGMPGELESLDLQELKLSAVGLDVAGSGAFTFDNTDLETFDGFPRPQGEANVSITGVNSLIDTLIGMGLLEEQQATMGRLMIGMFAQPAGDDALTSKLEVTEDGQVLANGQRIR